MSFCALPPPDIGSHHFELLYRPLLVHAMQKRHLTTQESSLDKHEGTGDIQNNVSQTQEPHHRFKRKLSLSSQSSRGGHHLKKPLGVQQIGEFPRSPNDGDLIHFGSKINEINGGLPGRSVTSSGVQSDGEADKVEEQGSERTNESNVSSSAKLDSELVDSSDDDSDHFSLAEERDVENSSKWCSICQMVGRRMMQGRRCPSLGTWQDLQARAGCPSCDSMLSLAPRFDPRNPEEKLVLVRMSSGSVPSYTFAVEPEEHHHDPVDLVSTNRVIKADPMGVLVDSNWFDIAKLQRWLALCDRHHGAGCQRLPIQESVSTRPWFLIDVEQGCLVKPHGGERYFALSYVWGTQQTVGRATKDNIESLQRRGSIVAGNADAAFKLPQTIEDAIQLTKTLGERFLWVDRLCIIQDDMENWHSQIKKMGSIYANAYCTFIASGRDADHGILGLNRNSGPRQLPPRASIDFPSLRMVEMNTSSLALESTWNGRGWTYQELKLSRRAMLFNNDVSWICQEVRWQEDLISEPEEAGLSLMDPKLFPSLLKVEPWPNFTQWGHVISDYCHRSFRYEYEAGAAFAGIEEILSHSFPGGFCFGLPEFYFDIALLWRPMYPLRRRAPGPKESSYLPSWSFLGWKDGYVDWPDTVGFACEWLSMLQIEDVDPLCATTSIVPKVSWMQKGPSGNERRIKNDYQIWKTHQQQRPLEEHAKQGWRRIDDEWEHTLIPNQRFLYPVPIGFQTVDDNKYHTWPATLRLRSQSTFLTISCVLQKPKPTPHYCLSVTLVTSTNQWAGLLYLNTNTETNISFGERCELVSLSYGSVSKGDEYAKNWLDEWDLVGQPQATEPGLYEFYNVMWIKREDTHVLREAIGRVEKSIWDSQALKGIDVELR